jgi:hypothetical protein
MRRIRIDVGRMIEAIEEGTDDPLASLGMSKDRWLWDESDEDIREKREAEITDKLHWEL